MFSKEFLVRKYLVASGFFPMLLIDYCSKESEQLFSQYQCEFNGFFYISS